MGLRKKKAQTGSGPGLFASLPSYWPQDRQARFFNAPAMLSNAAFKVGRAVAMFMRM